MATNPHIQDTVYRIVGEEVARKEFHPGPMARAIADASGHAELVQSLYIKYRYEELVRQIERDIAAKELECAAEEEQRRHLDASTGVFTCPYCGYRGRPVRKPRGSWPVLLVLFCLYIVPGLIYMLAYSGYKAVCAKCGETLIRKLDEV